MLESLIGFVLAIALGALIGMERSYSGQQQGFGGTRTFSLISFLGALSLFFSQVFNNQWLLIIVMLLAFVIVAISYAITARQGYLGITTEITALITFIFGALVMSDEYRALTIILVVSIFAILNLKEFFKGFVKKTTQMEINDTVKFLIIAFVVLPILPDQQLKSLVGEQALFLSLPLQLQEMIGAINLHSIWFMIVIYASTGFVGYYLIKLLGQKKGIAANAFLGGLTSATAINLTLIDYSLKIKKKENFYSLISSSALSNLSMIIRIVVLISLVNYSLTQAIIGPFFLIIVFNLLFYFVLRLKSKKAKQMAFTLSNPLDLKRAINFGLIFLLIIFLSQLALNSFGNIGLYLVGALSSIFQVTGYILNIAELLNNQGSPLLVGYVSIAIVMVMTSVVKAIYNYFKAPNIFGKQSLVYYLIFSFLTLISFLFFLPG